MSEDIQERIKTLIIQDRFNKTIEKLDIYEIKDISPKFEELILKHENSKQEYLNYSIEEILDRPEDEFLQLLSDCNITKNEMLNISDDEFKIKTIFMFKTFTEIILEMELNMSDTVENFIKNLKLCNETY